MYSINQEL